MNQILYDTAEILSACIKSCPVTLTVLNDTNTYNVCTKEGKYIWADDLPPDGYKGLLSAFGLLIAPKDCQRFMLTLADDGDSETHVKTVSFHLLFQPDTKIRIVKTRHKQTLFLSITNLSDAAARPSARHRAAI